MERIEFICVGTELLVEKVNTNVILVSEYLAKAGLMLQRNTVVPDRQEEIADCLRESLSRSQVVLVSGGLGPTFDDVTREAVASVFQRKLIFSSEIWEKIQAYFHHRQVKVPEIAKKQAYLIEGSKILPNKRGTAPGLLLEEKESGKLVILLPGPPSELEGMLVECVLPFLKDFFHFSEKKYFRFGIAGLPESLVEEKSCDLRKRYSEKVQFTIITVPGMIELLCQTTKENKSLCLEMEKELKEIFGDSFLGLNPPTLPEIVGKLLQQKKLTLAAAESCTGGLLGARITDIPGSSVYFKGSIVAYSNRWKRRLLKVPPTLLRKYGAVSQEVALAMAKGAKKAGQADVAISITGIAGPGGASPEKPPGLVWMAVVLPDKKTVSRRFLFSGTRTQIRERAVFSALEFLRQVIANREKKK